MKRRYFLLLLFLGYFATPTYALAKLTNSMNCTFKCSGKQCGAELNTLVGCLVSCNPAHYEKCWAAGEQKFSERSHLTDEEVQNYFKEFNKLPVRTQAIIIQTLEMARKISAMETSKKFSIDPIFSVNRDKMKSLLQKNLINSDQDLRNWIQKVLSLRIKDVNSALNLAGGGFSLSS